MNNSSLYKKEKYKKPNEKDIMLAGVYGGKPRGAKIDKSPYGSVRNSGQYIPPLSRNSKNCKFLIEK